MLDLELIRKFIFFIVCILYVTSINGQNALVTASADVSLENAEISYSIGQLFYDSHTVGNVSFLKGVQQSIVSISTSTEESFQFLEEQISIYPNPVDDFLYLTLDNKEDEEFYCRIYDINGQILVDEIFNFPRMRIDMQPFVPSLYLVRVFKNNTLIEDFKVLKK